MATELLEKRIEELERRVEDLERTCLRLMRQPLPPVVSVPATTTGGPQIPPYLPSMQIITSQ